MYNASKLLSLKGQGDRFINNISITEQQQADLLIARTKVRKTIRHAFTQVRNTLKGRAADHDLVLIEKIAPKFYTQGSFLYRTLNKPCSLCQEIDLDDGVYLPMSFINEEPSQLSKWFFEIIDQALQALCAKEGWKFNGEKDTCSRVELPGNAHIDVPLYAIPDDRHAEISERVASLKSQNMLFTEAMNSEDQSILEQVRLDEGSVWLARRGKSWKNSDPMIIADWFKREIILKGERLRRVCRYLKAWRDFIWDTGGPSSIALMICATEGYPFLDQDRDDYALLAVAKKLSSLLEGEIKNPTDKDDVIYPRDDTNVPEIVNKAECMASCIVSAIESSGSKAGVIEKLTECFGDRIPFNEAWVEKTGPADVVRSTKSIQVEAKPIPNTKAG